MSDDDKRYNVLSSKFNFDMKDNSDKEAIQRAIAQMDVIFEHGQEDTDITIRPSWKSLASIATKAKFIGGLNEQKRKTALLDVSYQKGMNSDVVVTDTVMVSVDISNPVSPTIEIASVSDGDDDPDPNTSHILDFLAGFETKRAKDIKFSFKEEIQCIDKSQERNVDEEVKCPTKYMYKNGLTKEEVDDIKSRILGI